MRNKRVKIHIRLLSVLLCAVMVLGIIPVTSASAAEETLTVSQSSVQLPKNSSVTVTAACSAGNVTPAYQWQIRVPGAGIWVDISGATGASIKVTYGMVASLMSGSTATIRAKATIGSGTVYTGEVTVNVTEAVTAKAAASAAVKTYALPRKTTTPAASVDKGALAKKAEEAKAAEAAALEALNQAKAELEPLNQAVADAQQAVTAAQQAVDAAKQALDAANTTQEASADPTGDTSAEETTTAPAKSVEELNAELAAANEALTAANTALEEAKANAAPAQAKVDEAQKAYDAAKAASDQAASTYSAATVSNDATTTYNVVINYLFQNNEIVADPYTASLAAGSNFSTTVTFPTIQGYLPYVGETQQNSLDLNFVGISEDATYNVVYKPTNVNYTVIHYKQNLNDDNYTEKERETQQGLTNSPVPDVAKTYPGFYSLLYEKPNIAADGSTVVEVYYDRYYYLMNFDLDGGYGVEPIYARYGSKIGDVGTPKKAGYTFDSWTPAIPATMPAENTTHTANWKVGESAFTVVFWYENANDDGYSVAGTYTPGNVAPGTQKKSDDYKGQSFTGRDDEHFTYNAGKAETVTVKGDGSTVLNVYYTRNIYTLTFPSVQLICGKVEHTHSHEECCTKTGWHISCNTSKCPVGYEHSHGDSCYRGDRIITAKYDSDITYIWENDPIKSLLDEGYVFMSSVTGKYYSFLEKMPGQDITMTKTKWSGYKYEWYYYLEVPAGMSTPEGATTRTDGGKTYYLYHTTTVYGDDLYLTYDEDYYPITGYTQRDTKVPEFNKEKAYLYYTRNVYELKFINYGTTVKTGTKYYQADISGEGFTPDYPSTLEDNAYVFDGWYTDQFFSENGKFDFTDATMPAGPVVLYAHWVPVSHSVEFYLDQAALNAGTKLSTHPDITVRHGSKAEPTPKTPENGSYTFVGWFYMENGVEKAFDFANMPVNKDMQVYGKWSSKVLKEYTIYYKYKDEAGNEIEIAAPTTGSGLAGITKTFDAKGGTDLYADYQEGYFPVTKSHSMTLDINATEENDTNVYTFWYVEKPAVPYTVHYYKAGTTEKVHDDKVVNDNKKAVVTETFVPVSGMMPDAYQKRLVVSAEEGAVNEIIFYYTEDTTHAYYKITHFTENLAKDAQGNTTWTEYASSQAVGDIGQTYTADSMTIPGFTYDSTVAGTVASGELTADGLELKLYYTRNSYPYQVRYLEQGTGKQLADPKDGTGKYGEVVSESAIDITNYDKVDPISQTLNIRIEDGNTAVLNVINFYYKEKEVTIKYQVVGPDGCGTVTPTSETVKVLTGTAQGSTPTAGNGFRFVGWYTDEACTTPVDNKWVTDNKLTPVKNSDAVWTSTTYYAKFEYDVTDLTITKQLTQASTKDESFVFTVSGAGINTTVVIKVEAGRPSNSITISGLKVGAAVTVTEDATYNRDYSATDKTKSVTLSADSTKNAVTISNSKSNVRWLSESGHIANWFKQN